MIHPKAPSPLYNHQKRKKLTKSGRTAPASPETIQLDQQTSSKDQTDVDTTDTLGFFESLEKEKAQAELAKALEKKKLYPIAPDAFLPNSSLRAMLQIKPIEIMPPKMFQLRMIPPAPSNAPEDELDDRLKRFAVLPKFDGIHSTVFQLLNKIDILDNLQNKTNKTLNWQNDDDEWVELGDPDAPIVESKPSSAKKLKTTRQASGTLVSRQQDTIPEIFKKMRKEHWWQQSDEDENNNLRSMLMYLIEILRSKQADSYESACNYVINIFQQYGIEPSIVNNIIKILLEHLSQGEDDLLNAATLRTVAQFMIERKDIVISLLNFTLKCQPDHILRYEAINAVKFITDVNNSEDIDLVLNNMQVANDAAEDSFSLKTIIDRIRYKLSKTSSANAKDQDATDEVEALHPLLKKISEERWFPRDNNPITLDSVIDAIISKLPNATKSTLKTLTTHIVQLDRVIGYSKEQFDRISQALISLLSHIDADYRMIVATVLSDLGKETKDVDIALLNSFINDQRVLVRTQCCDTLKQITSVTSETILKDCADDIEYLKTLPEEGFSLQSYVQQKYHVPTPTPPPPETTDDQPSEQIDTEQLNEKQAEDMEDENTPATNENEQTEEENVPLTNDDQQEKPEIPSEDSTHKATKEDNGDNMSRSPSPKVEEQVTVPKRPHEFQKTPTQYTITPSLNSSTTRITPVEPRIRVEISDRTKSIVQTSEHPSKQRKEPSHARPSPPISSETPRIYKQLTSSTEKTFRTTIRQPASGQSSGRRHLLPDNPEMWRSYAKQNEIREEGSDILQSSIENFEDKTHDPIQSIIDEHKHKYGYFRVNPNRPVLIPHKISFDAILTDQVHITINRRSSSQLTGVSSTKMHITDLNRNKSRLHKVEFEQLLSSLVIRSIQVHKQYERFIPGLLTPETNSLVDFTDALSISQMQLHPSANLYQSSFYIPKKLPPIEPKRPSSAEAARMKSEAHSTAARTGINLKKVKDMEGVLSNVLKSNREISQAVLSQRSPPSIPLRLDHNEVTHAWILDKMLRSQGASDSHSYIQQVVHAYPKFTPLLYSRVPQHLIPLICNDPVVKQLASIIANKHDEASSDISIKPGSMRDAIPQFDDAHSSNFFDYQASGQLLAMQQQRDEQRKDVLPPVRGVKMRLPRHVVKFGFRELEGESPEESLVSLRDDSTPKLRRRRIYMHLMMSVNEELCTRHELLKSQLRQMLKTDYRSPSYIPWMTRTPMCN